MPITKDIISRLKRTNISIDTEKTMLRVKDDFLPLRNKTKAAIVELTGLKRTSIYRVFREGLMGPKVALAMAQVLNVTPYYYTGETNKREPVTDALLKSFLIDKGYKKLAEFIQSEEDKEQKAVTAGNDLLLSSDFSNSPELNEAASLLTEESAITLLRALLIREKTGGKAAQTASIVKRCLLM